ncbi:MAG: hypothetical protein VZR28_11920 [Candidatus Cryptobacteroides sp.]|nr:hypothetical protein [Candidatus Cryptobacteroides sp.]
MNDLTWHCQLVLQNDEECAGVCDCFVTHVMNRTYHDMDGNAYTDQRRVRTYVLSQFLRNYVEETTDAGNEYNRRDPMACELLCGALQAIDFRQIAEDMIGDYSPKPAEAIAENEEYFNIMGFGNYDIDED